MGDTRETQSMRVRVYGRDYSIRSTEAAADTERVARNVDEAMRMVADSNHVIKSTTEIAVLVALHFANELDRTRERLSEVLRKVEKTTNALSRAVDDDTLPLE
jgi:cell division protein ZapA (FtsZ GTPase activity inhibitor)